MWKPTYDVIVAFSTEAINATQARKALAWGVTHLLGKPLLAPIDGHEYEIRTYQFFSEGQRNLFKTRVAKSLLGKSVQLEMEDEAGRVWSPNRSRSTS